MCLCFRSKKSLGSSPSVLNSKPVPVEVKSDDLSDAFQSFSIQSRPSAKAPACSTIQGVKPTPKGYIPTFPMSKHPSCRRCHWIPKYRDIVLPTNPNGNAGRPYFICFMCKKNGTPDSPTTGRGRGWISWDDYIGVDESNRPCFCGSVCRQDRAGVDSLCPGKGFWTCATGSCNYVSFRRDALTDDEAYRRGEPYDDGFEPWLL